MGQKILHLTLSKNWFDMILSGEKTDEYREIKPYWIKRLMVGPDEFKEFDIIRFKNGYSKNCPQFDIEFKGIRIGYGNQRWGATPNRKYFVIELGKIYQKEYEKSKELLIDDLNNLSKNPKVIVVSGQKSYTAKDLISEIENETDVGKKWVNAHMNITHEINK